MLMTRHLLPTLVTLAVAAGAGDAQAIGWGPASQGALIGQPLDFTAALRLDPGDSVAPECVHADVAIGDQRMPAVGVRLAVDASQPESLVMRVATVRPVDEPVVTVVLAVGCPARMSRRFVLLADPPDLAEARAAVADARPQAPSPAAAAIVPPTSATPSAEAVPARRTEAPAAATQPAPPRARSSAPATRHARRGTPHGAATPRVAAAPVPRPRLELEAAPPLSAEPPGAAASAVESALEAVAQAASAARSAASAASAAQQRVAELEAEVARLRREADASRQTLGEMRSRMVQADGASRWVWPLAALVLALAALAVWLAWRLKQAQEQRLRAWRAAAAAQAPERPPTPTSQLPMVTSEIMQVPPPYPARPATVGKGLAAPAPNPEAGPDTVPQIERTEVQASPPAVTTTTDPGAARDVSIEELLDLEQQAEFFIVLGQDEAAIDLLVDHLRDTGGGSPLPYLKLLEIYRRRDDREAYERTRMRFNHRFNAYAPDWDADLGEGRSLEDYPGVVPRLQQVWARPLDAMAELEALLFRKSRGQLFELPAYREVLFLYSLARDLLDREGADTGNVDLLLPLADGTDFGATTPKPYLALERDSVFDHGPEDRPTAPVDLDLSQPDGPSSIVDPLTPRR